MTAADLVALRGKMNLTQAALANLLDMTPRAIQDIENGRAQLRRIHVLAIERLTLSLGATFGALAWVDPIVLAEAKSVANMALTANPSTPS